MPEPKPALPTDGIPSPYDEMGLSAERVDAITAMRTATQKLRALGDIAAIGAIDTETSQLNTHMSKEAELLSTEKISQSVFDFTRQLPLAEGGYAGFQINDFSTIRMIEATAWWIKQPIAEKDYAVGYGALKQATWRGQDKSPVYVIGEHIIRSKKTAADAEVELLLAPAFQKTPQQTFLKIKTSLAKYNRSDELAMERLAKPIDDATFGLYSLDPRTGLYSLNQENVYGGYGDTKMNPAGKFRAFTSHTFGPHVKLLNVPDNPEELVKFNKGLDRELRRKGVERDDGVYEEVELNSDVVNTFHVLDTTLKLAMLFGEEAEHAKMVAALKQANTSIVW